jgi:DUF4097 and DUF4098 domain-containing protein YvlB
MKRPVVITLLIVALALVCVGIASVGFFTLNYGFRTNNPFDVRNISSKLEESKTLNVDTTKLLTLKVVDDAGAVAITGADVDSVEVKVVRTAYDSSQARADEEVKNIKYTIEQTGNVIILKYELPRSMNFSNNINTVDFVVTVPHEVTVDVNTNMGEVSVASTKGNVDIKNSFGDVTTEDIEGALSVHTNSGEVNATSIVAGSEKIDLSSDFGNVILKKADAKDITLDSNSGAITLSEVRATGDLTMNTDFGNTEFENGSADSLHIETNSGAVSLVKINISKQIFVKDDFGDIELTQAFATSYDLHANSGSITVDGAKGKLKADSDFGNITINDAESVTLTVETNSGTVEFGGSLGVGPHFIKSDFGGINLALPADSKLNVDFKTDFGKISSDIPITVTLTENSSSDKSQVTGSINGGGEQLTVQANSGSIAIEARGSSGPEQSSEVSDWIFPKDNVKSVAITNDAGDINVRPTEGSDILITATKSASAPDELNKVDIEVKQTGDVVAATLDYLPGQSSVAVDFDIQVPTGLSIQIESASGNITITNYQGALDISTFSGKIILQDVKGEIRASTANGDIETYNVDGNFHISSSNGNIVATYDAALQQVENPVLLSDVQTLWTYKITATGGQQVQDISSPKLPGNGQRIFENSSGAITLRLAPDLQADIFAQLFSENFKSDIGDMQASADKVRYVGRLNGGGPLIILTNASGAIRVEAIK